ncbi:MAG: hypothetical protein ACRESK_05375, partial [Gammaproteobacteria bacterium]
ISGICRKKSTVAGQAAANLPDLLICPDCLSRPEITMATLPPLEKAENRFQCPLCGASFPVVREVVFLLPTQLMRELYPEFAGR